MKLDVLQWPANPKTRTIIEELKNLHFLPNRVKKELKNKNLFQSERLL